MYGALSDEIRSGRIAHGEHLQLDGELGEHFQASRSTVSAVMRDLARDGLVERRPGRPTSVSYLDRRRALGFDVSAFDPLDLGGFVELIPLLEGPCASSRVRRFEQMRDGRRLSSLTIDCAASWWWPDQTTLRWDELGPPPSLRYSVTTSQVTAPSPSDARWQFIVTFVDMGGEKVCSLGVDLDADFFDVALDATSDGLHGLGDDGPVPATRAEPSRSAAAVVLGLVRPPIARV